MKMSSVILTIVVLCSGALAVSIDQLMVDEWHGFKLEHNKVYDSFTEEQYRYGVYLDNRDYIAQHNQRYALGLETYEMGINHLADLTHEEFLQQNTGLDSPPAEGLDFEYDDDLTDQLLEDDTAQNAFDWREKYKLGAVKNQKKCGSCWSFAALTALEHHLQIHKGVKVELSEQQLIDCSREYGNKGCDGGSTKRAYNYIKDKGIAKAVDYKYEALNGKCKYRKSMRRASIKGFELLYNEKSMRIKLASVGPLAVSIHVSKNFKFYKSGIYNEPGCSKVTNHAVVIVGYGQKGDQQYWIVQNSWGPDWGENGFILMSRNKNNQCGINNKPIYPIV